MGIIRVLTSKGDEKIEWDPADKKATDAARAEFKRLKGEGYNFYEVSEARGKPVTRFDAKAGKLLAAPGAKSTRDRETRSRPAAMAGGPLEKSVRLG